MSVFFFSYMFRVTRSLPAIIIPSSCQKMLEVPVEPFFLKKSFFS